MTTTTQHRAVIAVASLTGNTAFIAQRISQGLQEGGFTDVQIIDVTVPTPQTIESLRTAIVGADAIGLGSPVVGLKEIKPVRTAITSLGGDSLQGKAGFVFCTCGADTQKPGKANSNMAASISSLGAVVVGSLIVYAPHNMQTEQGKKWQWSEGEVSRAQRFGRDISPLMLAHPLVPGPAPGADFMSRCISWAVGHTLAVAVFGSISLDSSTCARCGLCARSCPNSAIEIEDGGLPKWDSGRCERCFRCVNHCPRRSLSSQRLNPQQQYSFVPSCIVPDEGFTARQVPQ